MISPSSCRVLHVLPRLQSGGIEQYIIDTFRSPERLSEMYVASAGGMLAAHLQQENHITLPLAGKSLWAAYRNISALEKVIKTYNIQLVHAHSRFPAWSAYMATKRMNIPFLTTYHGLYNQHNLLKKYYNSIMVRGGGVVAISQFVADHIRSTYASYQPNVHVIPEGIDTKHFCRSAVSAADIKQQRVVWGASPDQSVIFLPGRLTRWKGQAVFIEALKLLSGINYTAVIMGDDQGRTSYRKELEQAAAGLPLQFVKASQRIDIAYAAADIVVNCSTDPEAFGRTTAEALAMEAVYIGTDHGATPELCPFPEWRVPPNNPEALAQALVRQLNLSAEQKRHLTTQARHHINQHFSRSIMVQQLDHLYLKIIETFYGATTYA